MIKKVSGITFILLLVLSACVFAGYGSGAMDGTGPISAITNGEPVTVSGVVASIGSGGGMEPKIKAFAQKHNLQKNIIQTGYVGHDEIPAHLSVMDIVLAPYPNLKFFYYSPVKIFEYMAAGKAVVSTNIGQIKEIIYNGEDGILCQPDNFDEIVTSIEWLLEHPEKRKRIGASARQTIREHHTWLRKAKEWESICQNVYERNIVRYR